MQDMQCDLENCTEEKNAVADVNRSLIKSQETWRNKVKEVEEREAMAMKLRDEKIRDLEEQIRDLSIYMEAQKAIDKMEDSGGIKEGTLLPVEYQQSSSGSKAKENRKSGRR